MKKVNEISQVERFNSEPLSEVLCELDPECIGQIAERYSNLYLFITSLVIKNKIDLRDCCPIFGGNLDKADTLLFNTQIDIENLQKIDRAIQEGLSKETLKEVA